MWLFSVIVILFHIMAFVLIRIIFRIRALFLVIRSNMELFLVILLHIVACLFVTHLDFMFICDLLIL